MYGGRRGGQGIAYIDDLSAFGDLMLSDQHITGKRTFWMFFFNDCFVVCIRVFEI
jgi:hypothetical protein